MQPILLFPSPLIPPLHRSSKLNTHVTATTHSPLLSHASSSANTTANTSSTTTLSLLKSYSRAGLMCKARALFDSMPNKTPVSWTILMSGYAHHGPCSEVLTLLHDMLQELSDVGLRPDPFVLSVALKACASTGSLRHGHQVHCAAVKLGYLEDLFVANGLVTMYSSCGSVGYSGSVFKRIPQPDLVSWTSLLGGLVKNGYEEEALRLFTEMAQSRIRFDTYVLSLCLKASGNSNHIGLGSMIHCLTIKMGFASCLFLMNSLLEFYGRIGELGLMRKVFDKMLEKDLVSLNTVISCYARSNHNEEALMSFRKLMEGESSRCDDFTLGSILQAVGSSGALNHGKEIHGYVIRANYFGSNSYVTSALLDMYIKCVELLDATVPVRLFVHFHSLGGGVDGFLVASIVKWCASVKDLETGKMVHSCAMKLGLSSDSFVTSSLIDMYGKCGILGSSLGVFAGIQTSPGTVQWSSIIAAHCCNGAFAEALELFREMQSDGVGANEFTYSSAVLACLALGDRYTSGREIHCSVIRRGYSWNACVDQESACYVVNCRGCGCRPFQLNEVRAYLAAKRGLLTNNSLIDMYSKCGKLERAVDTFNGMSEKNSASWTAIIAAYVRGGRPSEALNQFVRMVRKGGKQPDTETFVHVLKACGKMGLVEEAFRVFTCMVEVYKLEPSQETYSAMVEALGSAGMLEEAQHFIGSVVPVELADAASIWRTLLTLSQAQCNVRIAKVATKKLVELE